MATVYVGESRWDQRVVRVQAPWRDAVSLRWRRGEAPPQRVSLDGVEIDVSTLSPRATVLLVPTRAGQLTWVDGRGAQRVRVDLPDRVRPSEAEEELLDTWWREVRRRAAEGPIRLERVGDVPLMPLGAMFDALRLADLDDLIRRQGLGAVQRIARRPKSWIRHEEAWVPIERVRRLSRRAEQELERQSDVFYDGVRPMPARVLGSHREEDLQLYENRVVATVVRILDDRARRRLRRLELALTRLREVTRSIDRAHALGQYRRWGLLRTALAGMEQETLASLIDEAEGVRAQLTGQLRAFSAFLESDVGRATRRTTQERFPPKQTNILDFDDDYRAVVELWSAHERERRETSEEDVEGDPYVAYADHCLIALLKGLSVCRLRPEAPDQALSLASAHRSRWCDGDRWEVHVHRSAGPRGQMDVDVWDVHAKRRDQRAGRRPRPLHKLRLVPTLTPLAEARPEAAEERRVVWLHPVDTLPEAYDEAVERMHFGEAPASGGDAPALAIPIAPWVFQGEDRLARLIRRFTLWHDFTDGASVPETCPSCGGPGRSTGREDFMCLDGECGSRWGRRTCGCGAVIPKVLPKQPPVAAFDQQVLDAWKGGPRLSLAVDMGGSELLASPCLHYEGMGGDMLICPGCGDCGRQGCGSSGDCPRC